MKNLIFSYENSLIDLDTLEDEKSKLVEKIREIKKELQKNQGSPYNFFNLKNIDIEKILSLKKEIQILNPTLLVIIGIGGSNLATKTLYEALFGKFYNYFDHKLKIIFADTIDEYYTKSLLELVELELKQNKKVILNIVSKSGSTTEIVVNKSLFIDLLKRYNSDLKKQIIITTDKDSPLYKEAEKDGYKILEIPKEIGGRYSAFTPVSLLPLAILSIDIKNLLKNIYPTDFLNEDILDNPAAISALIVYKHYQSGKNIHDTFVFSSDLETLGNWYRQLCAESLGKNHNVGITPTVSVATVDLHSVLQLYLAGPNDKLTTFVSYKNEPEAVIVKDNSELKGKSITLIKNCIFKGVESAYIKNKRPFLKIALKEKSESCVSELMLFKMTEIVFLGHLLEINPFDQPAVELYKQEAKLCLKIK